MSTNELLPRAGRETSVDNREGRVRETKWPIALLTEKLEETHKACAHIFFSCSHTSSDFKYCHLLWIISLGLFYTPSLCLPLIAFTYPDQTGLRITPPAVCMHTGLLQSTLLATSPCPRERSQHQQCCDGLINIWHDGEGGEQLPSLCSSPIYSNHWGKKNLNSQ